MDWIARNFFKLWVANLIFTLVVLGLLSWVAVHFISKYW